MNTTYKEGVYGLQDLLQKNYDAVNGYKKAIENTTNKPLKGWLKDQAIQRSNFANAIDSQLRAINETPVESGTPLAKAHRAWIDVKTTLALNTDESILEECIRGEEASVAEYEEKINSNHYTSQLNNLLVNQLTEIKSTLNLARTLETISE